MILKVDNIYKLLCSINMIPVHEDNYSLVDLNKETLNIAELKY